MNTDERHVRGAARLTIAPNRFGTAHSPLEKTWRTAGQTGGTRSRGSVARLNVICLMGVCDGGKRTYRIDEMENKADGRVVAAFERWSQYTHPASACRLGTERNEYRAHILD
jgi:hypothetical protein